MSDNPSQPIINYGSSIAADMPVTFKDGERPVPAWLVQLVGGKEMMEKLAPSCSKVTYQQFYSQALNRGFALGVKRVFDDFTGQHLREYGKR